METQKENDCAGLGFCASTVKACAKIGAASRRTLLPDLAFARSRNSQESTDLIQQGTEADLMDLPICGPAFAEVDALYPGLDRMRRRHEALRRVFGVMVEDVIAVARHRLEAAQPADADAIRHLGVTIIRFSDRLFRELKVIRGFLFTRMYRAPRVVEDRGPRPMWVCEDQVWGPWSGRPPKNPGPKPVFTVSRRECPRSATRTRLPSRRSSSWD